MDPQVHLGHKYGNFHRNFSLPVEPQVLDQSVAVSELRHFWSENKANVTTFCFNKAAQPKTFY
jgi:hypothetical protein